MNLFFDILTPFAAVLFRYVRQPYLARKVIVNSNTACQGSRRLLGHVRQIVAAIHADGI